MWKRRAATGPEARDHSSDSNDTEKRLSPLSEKRPKSVFKAPKQLKSDFGGAPNVIFWALLSLFAARGESLFFISFESDR